MRNHWLLLLALVCGCSQAPFGSGSDEGDAADRDGDGAASDEAALVGPPVEVGRPLLRFLNRSDSASLGALGVSAAGVGRIARARAGEGGDGAFHTATELAAVHLSQRDLKRLASAAAASPPADEACAETASRAAPGKLIVTPDDGDAPFVAAVDQARESIDVVMYELSAPSMRAALVRASQRGVHVRVIADRTRRGTPGLLSELAAAGVAAKASSSRFAFTHQKTMVVDGKSLVVFSGNFDVASFTHGRNFAVFLSDPEDVWDAEDVFAADWEDREPELACTRLVVAPINAKPRLVRLIDSATTSIVVEALYASDRDVTGALLAAKARGVDVRVLFNDPKFNVGDASATARVFSQHGIDARRSPSLFIHAKLIVVDGAAAFVGSENFSTNSLESNRELGIVVSSKTIDVQAILTVFEADFAAGVAFVPAP